MSERKLVRHIRGRAAQQTFNPRVRVAIGDDCAVLRLKAGEEALITTDYFLEGIHFRREWQTARAAGHICLARGLSDVAAMGGRPVSAFLSLACPAKLPPRWITGFVEGVLSLCDYYKVALAGGDTCTSASTGMIAHITVVGAVVKDGAVLRSGAKVGDNIYVTNSLGSAQAELQRLLAGKSSVRRYLPEPQVQAGQKLRPLATAMIDSSDGLSVDLAHICNESRVSAVLEAARIPIAKLATLEQALHGGEDYQLIFTAPPQKRVPQQIGGVRIHKIGNIIPRTNSAVLVRDEADVLSPLPMTGWQHQM